MRYCLNDSIKVATMIATITIAVLNDDFFNKTNWIERFDLDDYKFFQYLDIGNVNIVISRIFFLIAILCFVLLCCKLYLFFRWKVKIDGRNYCIEVEYGNLLKKKNCKKVINFDECFTTTVGKRIADINPTSLCGQYIKLNPSLNVEDLLRTSQISPAQTKSKYKNQTRYESGTIVPNGDELLMAFAKLDEVGKGCFFSRDEYIKCLDLLWKELQNYNGQNDVCIPVLGAGATLFDDGSGASISQQDLLNIMILSYKLTSYKIKKPQKLRIICRKCEGFSINNIDI